MKPNICARVRLSWEGNSNRIFAFCFSRITAPAKCSFMNAMTCLIVGAIDRTKGAIEMLYT